MLTSETGWDDSRGMCQFLAQAALVCLERVDKKSVQFGLLPNVHRLLEMYKHDAFEDDQPPGILAAIVQDEVSTSRIGDEARAWFEDIKNAMDAARRAAFGAARKDLVVKNLQELIRSISRGQSPEDLPPQKTRQARKFFKTLSTELHAG